MGSSGGAGKDTIAQLIMETARFDKCAMTPMALGQRIHELCREFGARPGDRDKLQDLGEAVREIFGMNAWIDLLDRRVKGQQHGGVIVTDIRKLLEYAHYVVEKGFLPVYVKTSPQVARQRLERRDGSYQEQDLQKGIEKQMLFIEGLPTRIIDGRLRKVISSGVFNGIYIIDNNGLLGETRKQIESWWQDVKAVHA